MCFICSFAINTTASGCLFKFTPALNNKYNDYFVNRKDDEAKWCLDIPEEINDLTVEVYDFIPGNKSIEPAWTSSSVSVPASKRKILKTVFMCSS